MVLTKFTVGVVLDWGAMLSSAFACLLFNFCPHIRSFSRALKDYLHYVHDCLKWLCSSALFLVLYLFAIYYISGRRNIVWPNWYFSTRGSLTKIWLSDCSVENTFMHAGTHMCNTIAKLTLVVKLWVPLSSYWLPLLTSCNCQLTVSNIIYVCKLATCKYPGNEASCM